MFRKLKNGAEVPELSEPVVLTIQTKCPEKWVLLDKETGEVYTPHTTPGPLQWKRIETKDARY